MRLCRSNLCWQQHITSLSNNQMSLTLFKKKKKKSIHARAQAPAIILLGRETAQSSYPFVFQSSSTNIYIYKTNFCTVLGQQVLYDYNAHKPMGNNRGSAFMAALTFKSLVYTWSKMCFSSLEKSRLHFKSDAWHTLKLQGIGVCNLSRKFCRIKKKLFTARLVLHFFTERSERVRCCIPNHILYSKDA